jgi:hypothetical protein
VAEVAGAAAAVVAAVADSVVAAVAGLVAAEVAASASAAVVAAAAGSVASGSVAAGLGLARVAADPGERAACAKSHETRRCDGRRINSGLAQRPDKLGVGHHFAKVHKAAF